MHTPRVTTILVLLALLGSAGCIANMPELKERLGYASAPPPPPTYLPPLVKAQVSSPNALVGSSLQFTSEGTRDPQSLPLEYSWTFGDGAVAIGPSAAHSYQKPGDYAVHLIVENTAGMSDSAVLRLQVVQGNRPPVAVFTPPTGAVAGARAGFDASASSDPDGGPLTYAWDFGDGATSLDAAPTHVYATPGLYQVKLRVTDNGGLTSEVTHPLGVSGTTRHAGHVDLTSADPASVPVTVSPGETSLTAVLSFSHGALDANNLTLVLKDPSGKVVKTVSYAVPTPPDAMDGPVTLQASVPSPAPGAWSVQVARGSASPTGVDYALDVTEAF